MTSLEITRSDDLRTIAFKVCTALSLQGLQAVLTGGSAATVYAPVAYQSADLDFIAGYSYLQDAYQRTLSDLGFVRSGRMFKHPEVSYTIDFPDDEILIAGDHVKEFATLRENDLLLNILTATDCVRDRLCWFYWYKDLSALAAAVGVAANNPIDLGKVQEWSQREGTLEKFEAFKRRLSQAPRPVGLARGMVEISPDAFEPLSDHEMRDWDAEDT
jgi:hypothetical protein